MFLGILLIFVGAVLFAMGGDPRPLKFCIGMVATAVSTLLTNDPAVPWTVFTITIVWTFVR